MTKTLELCIYVNFTNKTIDRFRILVIVIRTYIQNIGQIVSDRDPCVAQVELTISYELSACLIALSAAFLKSLPKRDAPQA